MVKIRPRQRLLLPLLVFASLSILVVASSSSLADSRLSAQAMEAGQVAFSKGHFAEAAQAWERAAREFENDGQSDQQARALLYYSEALYYLGHYRKAAGSLDLALQLASQSHNQPLLAQILGRLGNVAFALDLQQDAERYLTQGLSLARSIEDSALVAAILNDRGNVLASQGLYNKALGSFTESTILADAIGHHSLAVTALINAAWSSLFEGQLTASKDRLDLASTQVTLLQDSHEKAQELLSIGLAYDRLRKLLQSSNVKLTRQSAEAFQKSAELAHRLRDHRTASYGWGHLGTLYEAEGRYDEALDLTRRAIQAAQQVAVPESLYLWEWQTGRLLKAQGKIDESILAYRRAIYTLQPIRREVTRGFHQQYESFRSSIGPLFFELVDLLLTQADQTRSALEYQRLLGNARRTMEQLKTAELQDYFRDNCVASLLEKRSNVDEIVKNLKHTAVVYPILLPDRVELLVSVHNGEKAEFKRERVAVTQQELAKQVRVLRRYLEKRTTREYLPHAQQVYSWLIQPIRHYLAQFEIHTLVFVPDGPIRTIPLGALHDGKEFLIEQYALAITPGIVLTDPQPINRETIKMLSVGLTDSVQGFPSLPNVAEEIQTLTELYGGRVLLNQQFRVDELEYEMKDERPTIVHIASHAKFEDEAKNTFLLAFDGKLTMDRLNELIGLYQFRETPLDLLTLSACETAAGDDRAALGLAGVAVKAGARSALATLWFINDKATSELITEFYRQLQDASLSKAAALQKAKRKLIKHPTYQHPGYWSPFLLINNWL
ncbi:MAG: CHAT domain-containing protein [Nitrospirales bacterium]|nr:CHAT domain-containing protein [Nitrospira sp.]MDR4500994.1 CHAT domain-containing protein [Nitrospirales bacterium]